MATLDFLFFFFIKYEQVFPLFGKNRGKIVALSWDKSCSFSMETKGHSNFQNFDILWQLEALNLPHLTHFMYV